MRQYTVIEEWSNGHKWVHIITPEHRFIWKRAAREAWKPRTSKSRYQKRWDKYARKRYEARAWSPPPEVRFERIEFKGMSVVSDWT